MTATLRYTLPEEQQEFSAALRGQAVRGVLEELDNWLRAEVKHGEGPEARKDGLQEARDKLRSLLEEEGIQLW